MLDRHDILGVMLSANMRAASEIAGDRSVAAFPAQVSGGAFDDPRANVLVMGGTRYFAGTEDMFDVIIIDSADRRGRGSRFSRQHPTDNVGAAFVPVG